MAFDSSKIVNSINWGHYILERGRIWAVVTTVLKMAVMDCEDVQWLLMALVWSCWIFLKTFTQRLPLKLPVVICSFLKVSGDVIAYWASLCSTSHKVHFQSRKSWVLSSEKCAWAWWLQPVKREVYLLYLTILYL